MTARSNHVRIQPPRRDVVHIIKRQEKQRDPDWIVIAVIVSAVLLYAAWHYGRWYQLQVDQREADKWHQVRQ